MLVLFIDRIKTNNVCYGTHRRYARGKVGNTLPGPKTSAPSLRLGLAAWEEDRRSRVPHCSGVGAANATLPSEFHLGFAAAEMALIYMDFSAVRRFHRLRKIRNSPKFLRCRFDPYLYGALASIPPRACA